MRYDPTKLTEKAESFAEGYGKNLLSMTEAAKRAGYADPNGEVDRLMANPLVVKKVIEYLRTQAVKWQTLVSKAKKVLSDGMDATLMRDGALVADVKVRLEAARIVLISMKKDGLLLEESASEEDIAAESNVDLAKRILGTPPSQIN